MKKMNMYTKFMDGDILCCPYCGFHCTHQVSTEIFERDEDEDWKRVLITQTAILMDNKGKNPSDRRNGLRIYFTCEGCNNQPKLVIYQHKGNTFVQWEE